MQNLYSDQLMEEMIASFDNLSINGNDEPKNTDLPPTFQFQTTNIPIPLIFDIKKERKERENKKAKKRLEQRKMFNLFMKSVLKDKIYQISELVEIYNQVNYTNITNRQFSMFKEVRTCFIHKRTRNDSNERITIYQRK